MKKKSHPYCVRLLLSVYAERNLFFCGKRACQPYASQIERGEEAVFFALLHNAVLCSRVGVGTVNGSAAGRSKTPFHVRSRYGRQHHRALRARSKAVSRKEHAYGKQHRNKPGSFLQEEAHAAFLPVLPFILRWMLLRRRLLLRWRKPFPQRKRSPAQWQRCRLLRKQQPKKLLR